MSNSNLISFTNLSPNKNSPRNHKIDTITIHHMSGNCTAKNCAAMFAKKSRCASSNYVIGSDGTIGLCVNESDRSWCSSSKSNDNRAITIEVANDGGASTGWHVSAKAIDSLVNLCADICKRNGIDSLKWQGDKNLIGQVDKQNMTVHQWFNATDCPGDYLYSMLGHISDEVNSILYPKVEVIKNSSDDLESVARAVIRGKYGNGHDVRAAKLSSEGYDYETIRKIVNQMIKGTYVSGSAATQDPTPIIAVDLAPNKDHCAITASDPAQKFNSRLSGTYKVKDDVNMRTGAGIAKALIVEVPKGATVKNYGYYSFVGTSKWMYVVYEDIARNTTYTGFVSGNFITK